MRISDWSSDVCSSDLRLALGEAESLVQRDRGFESPARSGFQAEALEAVGLRGIDDMIEHMRGDALPQEGFGGAHRLDLAMLRIEHFERAAPCEFVIAVDRPRSEEHTSELQSLMRISYAVFCLKKKTH